MRCTLFGIVFNSLVCLVGLTGQAKSDDAPKVILDSEVREISSKRYTELLRVACFNGFRYRQADIIHGYIRYYEELRLALIDQGVIILPDLRQPQLIVASIVTDAGTPGMAGPEQGCFRARWSRN